MQNLWIRGGLGHGAAVIHLSVHTRNVVCVLRSDDSWRRPQLWHIPCAYKRSNMAPEKRALGRQRQRKKGRELKPEGS